MSTTVALQVSAEEYTRSTYHPDCDHVDGLLEERNVGKKRHSYAQVQAVKWFDQVASGHLEPYVKQRIRIHTARFRVPDFIAFSDKL